MRNHGALICVPALVVAACAHAPAYETLIDGAVTPTAECVARTLRAHGDLTVVADGETARYAHRSAALSGVVTVSPARLSYAHTLRRDDRADDLGQPSHETTNTLGREIDDAIAAACVSGEN